MSWVVASVGLAFCGLLVLALCTYRVLVAVRHLAAELDQAHRRLEPGQARLHAQLRSLRMDD